MRVPLELNLLRSRPLRSNPVLQRELLANLRSPRAFLLLALYQLVLSAVVLLAWPETTRLDLTESPASAKKLVNLFFLGQYVLASLMAPSFAAGAITGEKERKTYEMLLASPLHPTAIVFGKWIASLTPLVILIIASLPIVVLCLPLGGVSLYEVLAAYLGLTVSVLVFGGIGIACSSYFRRTIASLVVSYLLILPLVIGAVLLWVSLEGQGELRVRLALMVLPAYGIALLCLLGANAAARMLYPPDVGSEGEEVVDLQQEAREAIGLVIQRDQFPDRLFAPPKRQSLLPDGANPVYDKEIHSEIFSQGTLMLRLVIQISMLLAIPLMAIFLFLRPQWCAWYALYVLVFTILVGPVFSAGSITSERERQTLDLLLTTILTPMQILWGKLLVSLRVAAVLTSFLLWPVLLASILVSQYWSNWLSIALMVAIIGVAILVNSILAMLWSTLCEKTSTSLSVTYLSLLALYGVPLALQLVLGLGQGGAVAGTSSSETLASSETLGMLLARWSGIASPFSALFNLPLGAELSADGTTVVAVGNLPLVAGYFLTSAVLLVAMLWTISWRLKHRAPAG